MKKIICIITLFTLIPGMSNLIQAQTSVSSGNWSNPSTWGGVPPVGNGTVIINHNVTLDIDYSHTSGSITINPNGSLTDNSPMRAFALNYPNGTASLMVNGTFSVARVLLNSGIVNNSGYFISDSLMNSSSFTNNNGATLNVSQFTNNTNGTLNNSGSITTINFLNIETLTNTGTMASNDFTNSKSLTNTNIGNINISNDFSNIDSLASPAILTNDGSVSVNHNWHNGNLINGSGRFCIGNNSWNSGTMSGTFDFCDQTGGNVDLNTGTITGTISYCTFPCNVGVGGFFEDQVISIYPNPFSMESTLETGQVLRGTTLTLCNSFGQTVKQINNIRGQKVIINRENLASGLYFIQLIDENKILSTNKLIITD